jgi:hypothetical protein
MLQTLAFLEEKSVNLRNPNSAFSTLVTTFVSMQFFVSKFLSVVVLDTYINVHTYVLVRVSLLSLATFVGVNFEVDHNKKPADS